MGDIFSRIEDDIADYLARCEKYGEKPEYGVDASGHKYPNAYGRHAQELEERERSGRYDQSDKQGVTMPWIGVDLDGTMAELKDWRGVEYVGEPIPEMVERVKRWLNEGKEVRIFTARASDPDPRTIPAIQAWSQKVFGRALRVTNVKDYECVAIWDDRAVRVDQNKGTPMSPVCNCGHSHTKRCTHCETEPGYYVKGDAE